MIIYHCILNLLMSHVSYLYSIFNENLDHVFYFLHLLQIFTTEYCKYLLNSCWFNLINLVQLTQISANWNTNICAPAEKYKLITFLQHC